MVRLQLHMLLGFECNCVGDFFIGTVVFSMSSTED